MGRGTWRCATATSTGRGRTRSGEAGVVAIFLRAVADGRRPTIFGDGSQERDYVYVGDVARATLAAAQIARRRAQRGHRPRDVRARARGRDAPRDRPRDRPEHGPERLGDLKRSVLDPSLAERDLGWRPEVSLEDGLRETWQYSSTASG